MVTVLAPAAEVADRVPPAAGVIEPIDDRSCTFATGADDLTALAAHLGRLDVDFRVDGPPELVAALRDLAHRYSRAITLRRSLP